MLASEAAILLKESEVSGELLARKIRELIEDPERIRTDGCEFFASGAERRGRARGHDDGEIYDS